MLYPTFVTSRLCSLCCYDPTTAISPKPSHEVIRLRHRKRSLVFWLGTLTLVSVAPAIEGYAQNLPAPVPGSSKQGTSPLPTGPAAIVPPAASAPTITKIDPDRFLVAGGSIITITGKNFGGATVDFGGTPSPHVIVQDPATIKATVPGGKAGKVPVKVTTSAGTVTGGSITYVDAKNCWLFPTVGMCEGDATVREANINSYYNSTGKLTFLDQVKSIYNGASSSATVSADLTTLNFSNGMQMTAGTNLQAGSSGTLTNVARGTIPTLSANGAAQAAGT